MGGWGYVVVDKMPFQKKEHQKQHEQTPETTPEEQTKYTICLPYIAGIGEDLRRVCRKFNIRTVFTTTNIRGQQLTKKRKTQTQP